MEIFPTCVRQSGIGFCSFISQIISIGGPYTIALGMTSLAVYTRKKPRGAILENFLNILNEK